ncbi:recombinase RecA [bacterium]|nr:recombinase RecA [bacterium]
MEKQDQRAKSLEIALSQIEKQFGKGSIMKLGDSFSRLAIPVISTGSLGLDLALGVGGVPRGRVIEIFGPESSGKTTLALHVIAEAQNTGGTAAFIDAEHALDPNYARCLGVDVENLWVSQPDSGEQALEIAETLVRCGVIDVIVIDSVAALVPRAELEGQMGDAHVGLQARLMSQALRKLTAAISKSKTAVVFINQTRMKIGTFFGNPETTSGGTALKFYASIRMKIRRTTSIKDKEKATGMVAVVTVVKNKVAPPFKEATFDLLYGEGISKEGELIDYGAEMGILQKSGIWYSMGEERLGQGRENARMFLKENPDIAKKIEIAIRKEMGLIPADDKPADEPAKAESKDKGGKS